MYFKKIETEGLAHYSYMIGEGDEIAVIDPMRDVEVYMHEARKAGKRIKYILETHRNEDYISGSRELAHYTNAIVYISDHEDLGHVYGKKIRDGFELEVGSLTIRAIHTPGHTLGHLSFALYEEDKTKAYMVFSGDSLFMGDFGRTDFYGEENLIKMTEHMYKTVFEKLLPLGDHVLLCPAHGAGSACGDSLDDRPYSSLGYEKATNKLLKVKSKEEFVKKFASMRDRPNYFEHMKVLNVKGTDFVSNTVSLNTLTVKEIVKMKDDVLLLDARTKEGFIGGHIPGSVYLPKNNLISFMGSSYPVDSKLVFLIDKEMGEMEEIYWYCRRIGFDNILGYLPDSIEMWQESGHKIEQLPTISAKKYKKMSKDNDFILLDIRNVSEMEKEDPDENKMSISFTTLFEKYDKLNKDKTIYVLCASGNRATTATSFLRLKGFNAVVITGGAEMYRNFV